VIFSRRPAETQAQIRILNQSTHCIHQRVDITDGDEQPVAFMIDHLGDRGDRRGDDWNTTREALE